MHKAGGQQPAMVLGAAGCSCTQLA